MDISQSSLPLRRVSGRPGGNSALADMLRTTASVAGEVANRAMPMWLKVTGAVVSLATFASLGVAYAVYRPNRSSSTLTHASHRHTPELESTWRAIFETLGGLATETKVPLGVVSRYSSNSFRANSPNEDALMSFVYSDPEGSVRSLFGVFDGHSTKAASQFASEELPGFIERRLRVLDVQEKKLRASDVPNGSLLKFSNERSKMIKEALIAAFLDTDRFFLCESIILHLINGGQPGATRTSLERCFSGSCACVILIDRGVLYCANAGDCRAVLGMEIQLDDEYRDEDDHLLDYGNDERRNTMIVASSLSSDHNTDNQRELARIRQEHPHEEDLFSNGRIKGILKPTRHIGGALLKEPIARRFIRGDSLTANWHPPYTTAAPEVTYRTLTHADRFIIIGTDGLWDLVTNQDAVSLVVEFEHLRSKGLIPAELNVCTFIIERALAKAALPIMHRSGAKVAREQSHNHNNKTEIRSHQHHSSSSSSSNDSSSSNSRGHTSKADDVDGGDDDVFEGQPMAASHARLETVDEESTELSELDKLCTILSLPAHQRRDVYDDISVTVIYLDTGRREQAGTAMAALSSWAYPSFPGSIDRVAKLRKAVPLAKPLSRLIASGTAESIVIKKYLEECWPDRQLDRWTSTNLSTHKFLKSFGVDLAPFHTPASAKPTRRPAPMMTPASSTNHVPLSQTPSISPSPSSSSTSSTSSSKTSSSSSSTASSSSSSSHSSASHTEAHSFAPTAAPSLLDLGLDPMTPNGGVSFN